MSLRPYESADSVVTGRKTNKQTPNPPWISANFDASVSQGSHNKATMVDKGIEAGHAYGATEPSYPWSSNSR